MRVVQEWWAQDSIGGAAQTPAAERHDLVLAFGAPSLLEQAKVWECLERRWPNAKRVACSTAGEMIGTRVCDDSIAITAIEFDHTRVRCAEISVADASDSVEAGRMLAEQLGGPDLTHVVVLSDGLKVNGSELVRGMTAALPAGVGLTGGMAGDGARFHKTYVCVDRFDPMERVVGVGFYGSRLKVGFGSMGGWDAFGPERRITRSAGNVLYRLDDQPALDLYEKYLGEHAAALPASGLLFPLAVRMQRNERPVVRTILSIDREARSVTFAGDVPTGAFARLMHANMERLLDGAAGAARVSQVGDGSERAELAILISCVGRKLVLKQRVEEEVEAVRRVLGETVPLTGFYSYGEISPFDQSQRCELHNQTMTITTFSEK